MAVMDYELAYSITKAKEIINSLPIDQKSHVEDYINNLKSLIDEQAKTIGDMQKCFNLIKRFTDY